MIKYSLNCDKDHEFESWFPSAEDFETQARRGFVECPFCGSKLVSKAPMAPNVATSRKRAAIRAIDAGQAMAANTPAAPAPVPAPVALLDERQRELRAAIRDLHEKLTKDSTDVGEKFAQEARAMHEGDAPHRSIHGKATLAEAKALAEEGIPVLPLPVPPDERN